MMQLLATYRELLCDDSGLSQDDRRQAVANADATADVEFLDVEVPEALMQSIDGIDRVATIVRSMKSFGHPDQGIAAPTDINKALTDTAVVAGSQIRDVADVQTNFGTLPYVTCFASDMNQVWLNLIVNACHAIDSADRGRGVLGIRTSVDGEYVVVEISDTGAGVPPDIAGHIFDPFFTTKEVGKGTGQGLALCRSIVVDRHQGTITFDTSNEGTTFRVCLPIERS